MTFLKDWGKDGRRFLQADAFGGYDVIYEGRAGGQVTEVALLGARATEVIRGEDERLRDRDSGAGVHPAPV
jgi:hypothetical protein